MKKNKRHDPHPYVENPPIVLRTSMADSFGPCCLKSFKGYWFPHWWWPRWRWQQMMTIMMAMTILMTMTKIGKVAWKLWQAVDVHCWPLALEWPVCLLTHCLYLDGMTMKLSIAITIITTTITITFALEWPGCLLTNHYLYLDGTTIRISIIITITIEIVSG